MKQVDEAWPTEDVCEKAVCAFDTNGNPIIKKQREVCNVICQPVSLPRHRFRSKNHSAFFFNRDTSSSQYRISAAVNVLKRNVLWKTSFMKLVPNGRAQIIA